MNSILVQALPGLLHLGDYLVKVKIGLRVIHSS